MPKRKSHLSSRTTGSRAAKLRRIEESEPKRLDRLDEQRNRSSQIYARESSVERIYHLASNNDRNIQSRVRESSNKRYQRLTEQQSRSAKFRMVSRMAVSSYRSAFSYVPNIDYSEQNNIKIGPMNKICPKCNAKKWADEASGMCCSGGKVTLPEIQDPPELLKDLLTGSHPYSSNFLNNIRKYNSLFQMTSFGAKVVRESNFMPTFKIEGQVYHKIGSLLPEQGKNPQFLQIYFISDADQLSLRSNIAPTLKVDLIHECQILLNNNNNYITSFKNNMENNSSSEDLKLIIHADRSPGNEHKGRYNCPAINEVAILMVDEEKGPRDIVLHCRDGQLKRVSELHRAYDPLQYPLIFIKGDDGYYIGIAQENSTRNKTVSCMQFYAYRLMVRPNSFNALHYYRDLFSQYFVDMMAKMISERLHFIRRNQQKLRADDYIHLRDAVNQDANIQAANIGQCVILPSTFTGSPRYMHEKSQDALTYVRNYGKPDLFVTFTCNPEWLEIKNELFPRQSSFHRHDIISRVFHLKMKKLIQLFTKSEVFGSVKCYMATVEWQKRGLPHCHLLFWLDTKIQPDEIDKIISAELPNKESDPTLFEIVSKNMIHGPCCEINPTSPCMKNGICSKKYPRKFVSETQTGKEGYPLYRRRDPNNGGQTTTLNIRGKPVIIDNRNIVPYSPFLCRIFNAHINIEYCHSIKAIKYICKYINKGSDQATVSIENPNDEIEKYLNGRYISTSEAMWRLLDFNIHKRYPTVLHLAVHLENGQRVYFSSNTLQQVINNPRKTTLMAFFELCATDDFAKTLLYPEVPHYYRWADNKFSRRKHGEDVDGYPGIKKDTALGRVYNIHPNQTECFHLRMLLHHVRGPTSFESLRIVNGVVKETYQAACHERGLLKTDEHWEFTMKEAVIAQSPIMLRELFVIILLFCHPSEPTKLWELFKEDLSEDILHRERLLNLNPDLPFSEEIYNEGLILIEDKILELNDKTLNDFGLPSPNRSNKPSSHETLKKMHDKNQLTAYVKENLTRLIPEQLQAFNKIIESVEQNKGKVFFIDAPGGTGKTFLTNLILAKVRQMGKIALAVASSGIAATLLLGGKTAHSTFKLPLSASLHQESVCSIRKNGTIGKLLQQVSIIMWDECTMSHRTHVEAVNRTLKDFRNCNALMGGVTFVFTGDYRQTLPVIARGTRADIIKACLKSSVVWSSVETLNLRTNMRAHLARSNSDFPTELLKLGDGKLYNSVSSNNSTVVELNEKLGHIIYDIEELITKVYPDIDSILQKDFEWFCSRAIVCPRNNAVNEINNIILKKVPGDLRLYKSIDTVVQVEDAINYPQEFLNSLSPPALPPHELYLKIGVPIILLRNLSPPNLCNGTRLQIKNLREHLIEATILTGPATREMAHILQVPMIPTELPFSFQRLQFPVKVAFALTINKSQGQTFKTVGIDLRQECFTHGQLYVGLSRTGSAENQFILLPQGNKTTNIVYTEVLRP